MVLKDTLKDILRPYYRSYLSYKNKGDSVECNICGRSFKGLRPILGIHANGEKFVVENHLGSCWYCNSYPRMRQLWYWLENEFKINIRKEVKLLHVAPELSISTVLKNYKDLDYTCIDKHCNGYRYPNYVKNGDICDLSFPNNHFDLIICNHVLEHVLDDIKAMQEIRRVLKVGGIAILMVPIDVDMEKTDEEKPEENLTPAQREERFGQYDHVRMYGRDYFSRLESVGFSVNRIAFDSEITSKYGFTPGEEIIVCRKNR